MHRSDTPKLALIISVITSAIDPVQAPNVVGSSKIISS
jgi:hypothetical protein